MAIQDTINRLKETAIESKKILLAGVAIIAIGTTYAMTRHPHDVVNKASIGNSPIIHSHVNGDENPNYIAQIKASDAQRAEEAKKDNGFSMPTLIPNKDNASNNKDLNADDSAESGKKENKMPELPPADMPHVETTTQVAPVVKPKHIVHRKPKVYVDEKRIAQLSKWMSEDIHNMDTFNPAIIYENKEISTEKNTMVASNSNGLMNAGSDASLKNASATATDSTTFDIPVAGTMLEAHFASLVDSRTPGIVMGVIDSGPYAGARVLGSFQTASSSHRLMVSFNEMTVTWTDDNGDLRSKVLKITAYAVDPSNLSQGMATYVNRHVLAKIGFRMAASFMQGLGQAIQQSGSTAMMSASGGTAISQGNKTWTQEMLQAGGTSAGQVGNTLESLYGNVPDTIQIAQNTPFALLFVGQNDVAEHDAQVSSANKANANNQNSNMPQNNQAQMGMQYGLNNNYMNQ